MMNTPYDFEKLEAIMQAQGRRQTWLAQQVGVSVSMINHILKGRKPLTPKMGYKIARALGIPLIILERDIHEGNEMMTPEEAA